MKITVILFICTIDFIPRYEKRYIKVVKYRTKLRETHNDERKVQHKLKTSPKLWQTFTLIRLGGKATRESGTVNLSKSFTVHKTCTTATVENL